MGLFDFFSKRRERESAIPEAELDAATQDDAALGSFANPEGQPVVGQQVGAAGVGSTEIPGIPGGLAGLMQLGPMIQRAIESGNVQIEQGPTQTFDMRGSGLREEILQIMQQHGIDAEAGTASGQQVDAAAYGDMQQQILGALSKHGLDLSGGTPGAQIQPPAESGQ
jgi:hypothetical protein